MTKTTLILTIIAVIIAACLCLTGCAVSPVTTLELAVGAIEIALPLIPGVPTDVATAVESYLSATSAAITQASTILAGTGSDAQKAAAITAAFAGIAEPLVPAQYQSLATAVQKVAQYVAQFLTSTGSAANTTSTHALSAKDASRLAAVKTRAQTTTAKVRR